MAFLSISVHHLKLRLKEATFALDVLLQEVWKELPVPMQDLIINRNPFLAAPIRMNDRTNFPKSGTPFSFLLQQITMPL